MPKVIELQPGDEVTVARNFDVFEINDTLCEHVRVVGTAAEPGVRRFECAPCGVSITYTVTRA
jgi:hypothetical protein